VALSGDKYDYVAYRDVAFDNCPGFCESKDNGALVGYEHYEYDQARSEPNECRCLYDNGNVNLPETELNNVYSYDVTLKGTGAINDAMESSGEAGWWKCHKLDTYNPAQVPFSYVGGGFCRSVARNAYQQVKFKLDTETETAAVCMSKCDSLATSSNELVGYSAATRANPTNGACLCLFKEGTLPDPCPQGAEDCKTVSDDVKLSGVLPVRMTAGPTPPPVDCYRYNFFDGFPNDNAKQQTFDEVTEKYLTPTSGKGNPCIRLWSRSIITECKTNSIYRILSWRQWHAGLWPIRTIPT